MNIETILPITTTVVGAAVPTTQIPTAGYDGIIVFVAVNGVPNIPNVSGQWADPTAGFPILNPTAATVVQVIASFGKASFVGLMPADLVPMTKYYMLAWPMVPNLIIYSMPAVVGSSLTIGIQGWYDEIRVR